MPNSDSKNGDEARRGEISAEDRAKFKERASNLSKKLDAVKARNAPPDPVDRVRGAAMGQAMKIAIELVVGVAVGGFIGWYLDGQLGTKPWLLIVFLILGFSAGMANIIRTARKLQAQAEPLQRAAPAVKDDDET